MTDHPPHAGNGGFEREDMSAKAVYGFLIVLAVLGVVVYFVASGTYRGLNAYYGAHQPAQNPMKQSAEGDTRDLRKSKVDEKIKNTFPQPLLETDERNELTDFRMHEEQQLNTYGWVDQKAGVLHIPIERAMQLMAERGLPVHAGETSPPAPEKTAPSGKANAAQKTAKQ